MSGRLEVSNWGFPSNGVDSVIATQTLGGNTYRSGNISGGAPVHIRAYGRIREANTVAEGDYEIQSSIDYYRRLLTVYGPINVDVPPNKRVMMLGRGWQTTGGTSWRNHIEDQIDSLRYGPVVPDPGVGAFLAAHPAPTIRNINLVGPNPEVVLDAGEGGLGFFTSSSRPGQELSGVTLHDAGLLTIRVRGRAVWIFPAGVVLQGRVFVERYSGSTTAALVIVAAPATGTYPGKGIIIDNGMRSLDVPVILVTAGDCELAQQTETSTQSINYLSLFAPSLYVKGPTGGSGLFELRHTVDSPHDLPGGLIDILSSQGALPNASTSNGQLTLRRGTWKVAAN
jgi:hypothetical protein